MGGRGLFVPVGASILPTPEILSTDYGAALAEADGAADGLGKGVGDATGGWLGSG